MSSVKKSTLFPATLVTEMFNKVKGKSSIARLVSSEPIPFNGIDVFTFAFDSDISVVGEGGAKPAGDATLDPVQIRPVKVIYQSRVSDEFVSASEEVRLNYLRAFSEGFSKRLAAGLDLMMMHGVNPAAGIASAVIGNNHMDYVIANYASGANKITYISGTDAADDKLDEAIAKLDGEATGIILAPAYRDDIAALSVNGARKYPEFAWGQTPDTLGGVGVDSNKTVSANSSDDLAFVIDGNTIKWGFAKEVPLEVIEYGDPDGAGRDLKQYNEVLLRSEAYIGWGFLDAAGLAQVVQP